MTGLHEWFFAPQWKLFARDISPAGVAAFGGGVLAALLVSGILQSERVRRVLTKLGVDKKFVALVTAALSLIAFVACCVAGMHFAGVPISWDARIPGIELSLAVLLRLLILLAAVFWFSSHAPPPAVFFSGFGESSLDFELAVWSDEMSHRPRRFRSDLNFAIERRLREAGIEIPFPQRDLHIHRAPRSAASNGMPSRSESRPLA